ncbi:transporter [Spirochaeta thermophila DSM 6192]|uniref:Transporter n=2 Tax=Winmispira thermophila TaxID=154 RepID=E0RPE8_WINT6|nr:transporter [Spirochaeta thermophila DSM 6192]
MGYVIQHIGLFPHWTVERNICTVPRLLGWPPEQQRARALELLEMVGLPPEEYARKMPHQLSGGEAQRVGVARALAADPPVILMDEPFGAADPLTRSRLQEEFLAIQRRLRKTVVFVTHDMGEAIRLGDRIILMREGRVVREAATEDLVRSGDGFVKTFLGSESVLLLLECHTMEEIARPAPSTIPEELPRVPGAATVKEGLSLLLESGAPMLAVEEHGGILGIAGLKEIQALVRRGR